MNAPTALSALSLVCASTLLAAPQDPDLVPRTFTSLGVGSGGAQFQPAYAPHLQGVLFVASDMGHLQRSTDGGASFDVVDHRELQAGPDACLAFTADPQTVWGLDHRDDDLGKLVRSQDGGVTFAPAPLDPTGGDAWSVHADPSRSDRLLVAGYDRLFASTNGGSSFATVFTDAQHGVRVAGVAWDGARILVGTNTGVLESTDGGVTFHQAPFANWPANTGCSGFCGARAGAVLRLYAVTAPTPDLWPGVTGAEYAATTGVRVLDVAPGASWQPRTNGIAGQPFFAAMGSDPAVAFVAGSRFDGSEQAPAVWRTADGGASWQSVLHTQTNGNVRTSWQGHGGDRGWSYGEYALGFAVHPFDDRRAIVSDLGGFHLTDDGGANWRAGFVAPSSLNPAGASTPRFRSYASNGSQNTSVWALCWSDDRTMVACASDVRAMRSTDGGASWSLDFTGHTQNTLCHAVRHPDGTLYGGSSTAHDVYQSTYLADARLDGAGGQLLRSTDGGRQWSMLRDFGDPVIWLALDPRRPGTLYASTIDHAGGDGGVWHTDDLGNGANASWTRLATPPRTEGHPFVVRVLDDGTLVATFSGRRDGAGAFTASSGVFVSTDRGASWQDRSDPNMLWWTKDLVVDPSDATQSTWLVGVWSGWGGAPNGRGGLYRTLDRGQSWQRIWQSDRVSSCTVDPVDPSFAWVTTEREGLWCTTDLQVAAPSFRQVASFPFRQPERVFLAPHDPCAVWVTTFGNGIWRGETAFADLGGGKPGSTASRLCAGVQLSPGRAARYVVVDAVPGAAGLLAFGPQAAPVPLLGGTLVPFPVAITTFAIADAAGRAVVRIALPANAPLGAQVVAQFWSLDAGASFGVASTNALATAVR